MESIFDHNPTPTEIANFTLGLSKNEYLNKDKEILIADIAIMYYDRNNKEASKAYWNKVPDLYKEFMLGFDDEIKLIS